MKIKRRHILVGSVALGVVGISVVFYMAGVGQSKNVRAERLYQKAAKLIKTKAYDENQVTELIKRVMVVLPPKTEPIVSRVLG